jgi:hypothetical protein
MVPIFCGVSSALLYQLALLPDWQASSAFPSAELRNLVIL